MKKPTTAKAAKVKPAKPKTSTGKPNPKKKPPAKHVHVPASVRVQRHAAAVKAAKTRAVNAKKAKAHPRRKLALGSAVACCSAEALAASLRLSGWPVSDGDVLALYWHTARDEHAGASILATLEAAAEYGLAGVRPAWFGPVDLDADSEPEGWECGDHAQGPMHGSSVAHFGCTPRGQVLKGLAPEIRYPTVAILGLELPGPHAVLDTGAGWITWGERWPAWAFPGAVIEEAWAIEWEEHRGC